MTEKITPLNSRGESVRFIGNWHESIPRILFMDPFMHAQDRNVYCVIRALMSEEGIAPNREMRFPDYSEIMKYGNIGSRGTVARAITAARIIGWIVQNNSTEGRLVRDETSGRFKHRQWLFLDEPMPHSEICEYDHGFVAFIKQAAERQDEHISDLAQRVLVALIDDHGSEQDESLYERRLAAYETVIANPDDNSESRFFGISLKPGRSKLEASDSREEEKPPCTDTVLGKKPPCTNTVLGEMHQVGAITAKKGGKSGKNHHVQNLYMAPCSSSSSSSSRKTTTTKPGRSKTENSAFRANWFQSKFLRHFHNAIRQAAG